MPGNDLAVQVGHTVAEGFVIQLFELRMLPDGVSNLDHFVEEEPRSSSVNSCSSETHVFDEENV